MRLPLVSTRSRGSKGPPRVATSEPYVTSRNVRDVAEVLEKYMRSNPLLVAVFEGDGDEVRRIIDGGLVRIDRTDPFGNSALHVAAHSGHCSIVRLLVRRRIAIDATNCDGWTPLHFASLQSDVQMLQTLLAAGADVNARDIALRTPLHVVCHTGRALEALKALLRGGALIDARSANNNTPLLLCCELNDRPAAMLLASVGASVTNTRTLDKGGRTPEGWATKHGWCKQLMLGSLAPGRPLAPVVNRVESKCIGVKWLFPYVANEDATLADVDAYKVNGANVDCFDVQTGCVSSLLVSSPLKSVDFDFVRSLLLTIRIAPATTYYHVQVRATKRTARELDAVPLPLRGAPCPLRHVRNSWSPHCQEP